MSKDTKVTYEYLKRMNVEQSDAVIKVDLNKIIRKMLTNYADLLMADRFYNKYVLLCCLDMNGEFIYLCPNHSKVIGFAAEELIGKKGYDMIHPDDVKRVNHFIVDVLSSKQPKEITYRIKHKQGNYVTVQSVCMPYLVEDRAAAIICFSNNL